MEWEVVELNKKRLIMLQTNEILYCLDDVSIIPASISKISHRKQCCPFDDNYNLPIFTAPMPTVVNINNYKNYEKNNIYPIIPRTEDINDRLILCHTNWVSFSLSEFNKYFVENVFDKYIPNYSMYVLIDVANGNMEDIFKNVRTAKGFYSDDLKIMIGNIANPETYNMACHCGVDYVRISVGTGYACTTATNLGIYYPMASLIDKCKACSKSYKNPTKIIADGGIHNYRDIIKSLALGADYVMLGKMFAELKDINSENLTYYGMASNKGKKLLNNKNEFPPEGREIEINKINKTLEEFTNDIKGYIQSAMSYCNKSLLKDFIGKVEIKVISNNSSKSFNQ